MKYIVGAAVLVAVAAIAIPAMGAGEKPRVATNAEPQTRAKQVDVAPRARVRCRNVRCLNRKVTKLTRQVKVLRRDAFQCERLVDVTQYDGYLYDDGAGGAFPETALDFTLEGDVVDEAVVVYVC